MYVMTARAVLDYESILLRRNESLPVPFPVMTLPPISLPWGVLVPLRWLPRNDIRRGKDLDIPESTPRKLNA